MRIRNWEDDELNELPTVEPIPKHRPLDGPSLPKKKKHKKHNPFASEKKAFQEGK